MRRKCRAVTGTTRQPRMSRPRNAKVTATKAAAVPCPASTLITIPAPAAPTQAPRPAGLRLAGSARLALRAARRPGQRGTARLSARSGHGVGVAVGVPADRDEREHAAHIGEGAGSAGAHPATVADEIMRAGTRPATPRPLARSAAAGGQAV